MDNENRLAAMRWAAATRLEMKKGDRWQRRRDELIVAMVDNELDMNPYWMRDACGIVLAADMEIAFERIGNNEPPASEDMA